MRKTQSREDETAFANVTCQEHNFGKAATGWTNLHFNSQAELFYHNTEYFSWKELFQLYKFIKLGKNDEVFQHCFNREETQMSRRTE